MTTTMDILQRNNVKTVGLTADGQGARPLVFVHGYGCDQNMWRFVAPQFQDDHQIVHYDLTGMGKSDVNAYDFATYRRLNRHAEDLAEILQALDVTNCVLIGHSVGATIASLASLICPERISGLALISPSPFFMNDGNYTGGFDRETLDGLVDLMDQNFHGWTSQVAPLIGSNTSIANELTVSFCRTSPDIAKHFGRVTFLSDHRNDMKMVATKTTIVQCSNDSLAPVAVGQWLADNMPDAALNIIDATGHCPHLSEPAATTAQIRAFLTQLA
ncbi:alpha/beta fold hydrolase [Yoonia sp. MH D7]